MSKFKRAIITNDILRDMKHFLTKAVELLHPQPIYYTPTKVKKYVNKHKFDFLIQNPPYAVNNK
jgi:hypothetical protein